MVDVISGRSGASMKIYLEAQDRASGEVRRSLAAIRKQQQQYSRDAETLDRKRWDATHTARERDIRNAQEYFTRMRQKYAEDAAMRDRITSAEQARLTEIERAHAMKSPLRTAAMLRSSAAGAAVIAGAGLASGMMAYHRADTAARNASGAEGAVGAIINREQAKEELLSFVPVLGEVYRKIVQAVGGREGWEQLKGHIAQAKADFRDLSAAAAKATQQAALSAAAAFRMLPADVQALKDQMAADERGRGLERAAEQRQSAERAYSSARDQGLTGAPLAELRRQAQQAQREEERLQAASTAETRYAAIRRRQMDVDERTAFSRGARDAELAAVGGPFAGAMRSREDMDRRHEDALRQYEGLGDQRKAIDDKVGAERAAVEQKWAAHIASITDAQRAAEAKAARDREVAAVDAAHAQDYARLKELEERKTALTAQHAAERARIDRDAATARQRMIEDATTPVTGAEIRAAEIRALRRRQQDERQGYDRLSGEDKAALDRKHAAETSDLERRYQRADADAAEDIRRRAVASEIELSRSREAARAAELYALDQQLDKDRQRLSYSADLVRQAEALAALRKRAINERVDRERDLTVEGLRRAAIEAESANDQTLSAAKARELRDLEADIRRQKTAARAEDQAAIDAVKRAREQGITERYERLETDARRDVTVSALRMIGMNRVAEMLATRAQYDQMREQAADDPQRLGLIAAMQARSEAALRAGADMPVTRETGSMSSRFLRRSPGFDDPAMRQTEELAKHTRLLEQLVTHLTQGAPLKMITISSLKG